MERIVGIIPLVKGKISVVTGNLFQATSELGLNEYLQMLQLY